MRMMLLVIVLAGLCLVRDGAAKDPAAAVYVYNTENGVAIHGYDPVSYFAGKPVVGMSELSLNHEGIQYRFASGKNLQQFRENPRGFLPAYGGWCAWAMLEGKKVEVNPERFKIVDGVLYLFYNGFWGNTLKEWNRRAEKETEQALIIIADDHWQKIVSE